MARNNKRLVSFQVIYSVSTGVAFNVTRKYDISSLIRNGAPNMNENFVS